MNHLCRTIAVAAYAIRESGMNGWINWNWRRLAMPACLALGAVAGFAQVAPPVILKIDLDNYTQYWDDFPDPFKFATDVTQKPTTIGTFMSTLHLGDIVSVNGRPAKGTFINRSQLVRFNPTMTPGQSIADIFRSGGPGVHSFEILQVDGTPIGTIMGQWLVGGSPPPGAPAAVAAGNGAIVGGTGAFLGVRGQVGAVAGGVTRNVSYTEDPANRRLYGGGSQQGLQMMLSLIPMFRPEIQATPTGPAVVHSSDFSLVTTAKPAKAGEILSLFATGLGPVRAKVDPGRPFPTSPLALVNSPVEVMVNGNSAEVLAAVGYPGSVDGYQVNFRVPDGMSPGMAILQVIAAWIPSSAVSIAIQ